MTNWQTVEEAIEASGDAEGSAMKENQVYLDSIAGRQQTLARSTQEFYNKLINSDVIKYFLQLAQYVMDATNAIGPLATALTGIVVAFSAINKTSPLTLFKGLKEQMSMYGNAKNSFSILGSLSTGLNADQKNTFIDSNIKAYAAAVNGLNANKQALLLTTQGLNAAQVEEALKANGVAEADIQVAVSQDAVVAAQRQRIQSNGMVAVSEAQIAEANLSATAADWARKNSTDGLNASMVQSAVISGELTAEEGAQIISAFSLTAANEGLSASFTGLGVAIKTAFASNPIGFILTLATTILSLIPVVQGLIETNDDLIEKANEVKQAYEETTNEIKNNLQTITSLQEEFNKLSKGVDSQGNNLTLSTDDYARYKDIVQQIVEINPSLVQGYNDAASAIIDKNAAIQETINLLKQQKEEEARKATTGDNRTTMMEGVQASIDEVKEKQQDSKTKSIYQFGGILSKELAGVDMSQIMNLMGQFTDKTYAMNTVGTQLFAIENIDAIIEDLHSSDSKLKKYLTEEHRQELEDCIKIYQDNQSNFDTEMKSVYKEYNDFLKQSVEGIEGFSTLDDTTQQYISKYVMQLDIDDSNAELQIENAMNLVRNIVENQEPFKIQLETGTKAMKKTNDDGKALSVEAYKKQLADYKKEVYGEMGFEDASLILSMLGFDTVEKDLEDKLQKIRNTIKKEHFFDEANKDQFKEIEKYLETLDTTEIELFYSFSADAGSMTIEEIDAKIQELKHKTGTDVIKIKTYSDISAEIDKYKEAMTQTNEIVTDNIQVTEDYKNSLIALGVSAEELNECFYEANPLVVKNSDQLKTLVKKTKENTAQNIKLAKSQAMLKYAKLQKQSHDLATNYKKLNAAQRSELQSMFDEMATLQKSIARYASLEQSLLGATDAYERFANAQTLDSANNYDEQASNMVTALANGFTTAKLGTESVQEAIKGLVPKSVYKDMDTLEGKMDKIHEYFKEGKLSDYFDMEFDEKGNITKAEVALKNVKKFVEDGINSANVFTGSWEHFDLAPTIKTFDQLADKMGVTKEVAFAMMQEMEKYDIEWLGGDFSTLLDKLTPTQQELDAWKQEIELKSSKGENVTKDWEYYNAAQRSHSWETDAYRKQVEMSDLNQKYADGNIKPDEFATKYAALQQEMDAINKGAQNKVIDYKKIADEAEDVAKQLKDAQKELESSNGGKEAEEAAKKVEDLTDKYEDLIIEKAALGTVSEYELSMALEAAGIDANNLSAELKNVNAALQSAFDSSSIQKLQQYLQETYGLVLALDENGNVTINTAINFDEEKAQKLREIGALGEEGTINIDALTKLEGLNEIQKAELQKILDLSDKQNTIEMAMDLQGTDPVQTALDEINTTLKNINDAISSGKTIKINTTQAYNTIKNLEDRIANIQDGDVGVKINVAGASTLSTAVNNLSKLASYAGTAINVIFSNSGAGTVNGTANAMGSAFAQGNWGAPKTEESLVGELGR